MAMTMWVSKTFFKARALELFRQVEASREALVITDRGRPVLRLEPYYGDDDTALELLRDSVVSNAALTEPVGQRDWEALA